MTFFVQHGYGKGSKIANLVGSGHLSGVVLSPADEDRAAMSATVHQAHQSGMRVLLDPQMYIYATTPDGSARCHESHGLRVSGLHWSQDASATAAQIRSVEVANREVGITGLKIAPTVLQSSFADVWTPLAIQMARTAAAEWGGRDTLATVVIDEAALSDWQVVQDWLDVATTLDVRGFYFLVDRRRREYPTIAWEPNRLANLLRLIYRLSVLNEYELIWGYADFEGLLGLAAGASATCSGWSYTLRQFAVAKWQPSPAGGKPATARLSLGRLWVPVKAEAEAEPLFRSDLQSELFSRQFIMRFSSESFSTWTRLEAQEHHLRLLAQLADRISSDPDISTRARAVIGDLERARDALSRAARMGIALPPSYSGRVESFLAATAAFVSAEAL